MRQPPGLEGKDGQVCRLRRSLYGLKQAGREWNRRFNDFLIKLGFKRVTKEHCLYSRRNNENFEVIGVWVDDLFLLAKTPENMKSLKNEIHNEFEATDQGVPKYMLGIEIQVDSKINSIRLSQGRYIQKIIDRFEFEEIRPADIPMAPNLKLYPSTDDDVLVDVTQYRSAIGSLMYAAISTRPDIAFAVNSLAQYNVKPSENHWKAVMKVFGYLKRTKNVGILYDMCEGNAKLEVTGFTDAGNGVDTASGCPTSGGVYILAGGAIKWISERQRGPTLSEMESEFVASCKTAQAGLWIKDLLEDLGFKQSPANIWIDNTAAARITENPESHKRALHIQRKWFWVQKQHEKGTIVLHRVSSGQNVADIFTKPLARPSFENHRNSLGLSE